MIHKSNAVQVSFVSTPFIKALADAGIMPDKCKRLVIDCQAGQPITIHCEFMADERINDSSILDAVFELGLKIKVETAE